MRNRQMIKRVAVLEQRSVPAVTACTSCGGPVPGENEIVYVNDDRTPKYGVCSACGLALTPEGQPMCARPVTADEPPGRTVYILNVEWNWL